MYSSFKNALKAAVLWLTLFAPNSGVAQDMDQLAEEYLNIPGVQQMMDGMFAPELMAAQFAASLPPNYDVPAETLTRIGVLMSDEMNKIRPRLEQIMAQYAASTFTEDELRALIAFYSSEHGAAVMAKTQPYMQRVMADLAPELGALQQNVTPKIIEILQE